MDWVVIFSIAASSFGWSSLHWSSNARVDHSVRDKFSLVVGLLRNFLINLVTNILRSEANCRLLCVRFMIIR